MEFEFIPLEISGKEVEWLRNLLLATKLWPQQRSSISLFCVSISTLSRAYNKIYNGKFRHISFETWICQEINNK